MYDDDDDDDINSHMKVDLEFDKGSNQNINENPHVFVARVLVSINWKKETKIKEKLPSKKVMLF